MAVEVLPSAVADAGQEASFDRLLDGRISLYQPRKGHRAGTDAVLLAAAAPANLSGLVLDVGAGAGTVALILAQRSPLIQLGLIEDDPQIADYASRNLALNGFAERGTVHHADICCAASRGMSGLKPGAAALVVTNPPFADPSQVRISPHKGKSSAHVMRKSEADTKDGSALTQWIRSCLALLAPDGMFLMIHRPDALPEILTACEKRIGAVTILAVYPRKGQPANRILLRGKKGSKAPLAIAEPLILQDQGRFTPLCEAIHRGEALIEW